MEQLNDSETFILPSGKLADGNIPFIRDRSGLHLLSKSQPSTSSLHIVFGSEFWTSKEFDEMCDTSGKEFKGTATPLQQMFPDHVMIWLWNQEKLGFDWKEFEVFHSLRAYGIGKVGRLSNHTDRIGCRIGIGLCSIIN
jgi:hypothetical protein